MAYLQVHVSCHQVPLRREILARLAHLSDHDIVSPTSLSSLALLNPPATTTPREISFPLPNIGPLSKEVFHVRYLMEGLLARGLVQYSEVRRCRASCRRRRPLGRASSRSRGP